MAGHGPSTLVPLLVVGGLSLVICGPTVLSLAETVQPLVQIWDDDGRPSLSVFLLPVLLLLVIHFLTVFFPSLNNKFSAMNHQQGESLGSDGEGFGLGALLLVLLFLVLYNVM